MEEQKRKKAEKLQKEKDEEAMEEKRL
jgi:hypothetical protein